MMVRFFRLDCSKCRRLYIKFQWGNNLFLINRLLHAVQFAALTPMFLVVSCKQLFQQGNKIKSSNVNCKYFHIIIYRPLCNGDTVFSLKVETGRLYNIYIKD
jgi:hypothetical protein